jgi:predicted site-specific integrase-resolvase
MAVQTVALPSNGARRTVTKAGLYARVSTAEQSPNGQLEDLRAFAVARGWQWSEFVDHGVSGAKDRRPGLDALLAAVRARKLGVVACVKLDRLARSTHHLVTLAKELAALGVELVVLDQAIDTTTLPQGDCCSTSFRQSASLRGISSASGSSLASAAHALGAASLGDLASSTSMPIALACSGPKVCRSVR